MKVLSCCGTPPNLPHRCESAVLCAAVSCSGIAMPTTPAVPSTGPAQTARNLTLRTMSSGPPVCTHSEPQQPPKVFFAAQPCAASGVDQCSTRLVSWWARYQSPETGELSVCCIRSMTSGTTLPPARTRFVSGDPQVRLREDSETGVAIRPVQALNLHFSPGWSPRRRHGGRRWRNWIGQSSRQPAREPASRSAHSQAWRRVPLQTPLTGGQGGAQTTPTSEQHWLLFASLVALVVAIYSSG